MQIAVDPTLTSEIDAAIWWPEFYIPIPWLNTHRNVDLRLINPDGVLAHESVSVPSVFERSGALWSPDETPPPVPAHWTVEVEHLTGPGPFRVVYLAVWERH